jgi:hypothetical protein
MHILLVRTPNLDAVCPSSNSDEALAKTLLEVSEGVSMHPSSWCCRSLTILHK